MLRAGRHDEILGAIERLELELGTERGLRVADTELADQVVAIAPEDRMGAHAQMHIQVARGTVPGTQRAPSVEAERGSGVDTRGHIDLVGLLLDHPTLGSTTRTRCRDHLAESCTTRAGSR